jgi:hypothetical protein
VNYARQNKRCNMRKCQVLRTFSKILSSIQKRLPYDKFNVLSDPTIISILARELFALIRHPEWPGSKKRKTPMPKVQIKRYSFVVLLFIDLLVKLNFSFSFLNLSVFRCASFLFLSFIHYFSLKLFLINS